MTFKALKIISEPERKLKSIGHGKAVGVGSPNSDNHPGPIRAALRAQTTDEAERCWRNLDDDLERLIACPMG